MAWIGDWFKDAALGERRVDDNDDCVFDFDFDPLTRLSKWRRSYKTARWLEVFPREAVPLWERFARWLLSCPVFLPFWLPVWYFLQLLKSPWPVIEWDSSVPFAAFWLRGVLVWVFGIWPLFQLLWNMIVRYENPYMLKVRRTGPVLRVFREWHCFIFGGLGLLISSASTCLASSDIFARLMHSVRGGWPLLYEAVRPWLAF